MELTSLIFDIAEPVGIFAFAVSGESVAAKRGLDIFGVIFIGLTTALGGGVMRDVLLGYVPPRMFENGTAVCIAVLTSVGVFIYAKYQKAASIARADWVINFLDAVGLAVFSITGVQLETDAGFANNAFLCIFLALTTGVGGGILRDALIRETPKVFTKHVYALAAIAGAAAYYLMVKAGAPYVASLLTSVVITVSIRMLAAHYRWNLPTAKR